MPGFLPMHAALYRPLPRIRAFFTNLYTWSWHYWLFFCIVVPAVLLTIPLVPPAVLQQYCILDVDHPALVPMFLMNYTHLVLVHLCTNLVLYLCLVSGLFLIEPDRRAFRFCAAIFLVGLPLWLSFATVLFYQASGSVSGVFGFSGIVYAFLGYFLYRGISRTFAILAGRGGTRWPALPVPGKAAWLALAAVLDLVLVTGILSVVYIGGRIVPANGIAHVVGFLAGLLFPLCVDAEEHREVPAGSVSILLFAACTAALFGLYLVQWSRLAG